MSDLRHPKIKVKCPRCQGHKGIYGRSATGHPATLPCPRCDAVGEIDLESITDAESQESIKKIIEFIFKEPPIGGSSSDT